MDHRAHDLTTTAAATSTTTTITTTPPSDATSEAARSAISTPSATPVVDAWLRSMELTEKSRGADESCTRFLDELAGVAVDSEPAAKLLRTIRYKLEQDERSGGAVRLDAEHDAQNEAAVTVAQRLVNIGYLASANARDGRLHFAVNPLGDGQRTRLISFLKGSWLEHGVRHVARTELGADAELVLNLSVTGPTGLEYELDLVIGLPDGGLAVIECKAGDRAARYLPRFRDVCDAAGVDGPRAVLVASTVDSEVVADAQAFHRITVVTPDRFADHLRSLAPARSVPDRSVAVVAAEPAAVAPTLAVVPHLEPLAEAERPIPSFGPPRALGRLDGGAAGGLARLSS